MPKEAYWQDAIALPIRSNGKPFVPVRLRKHASTVGRFQYGAICATLTVDDDVRLWQAAIDHLFREAEFLCQHKQPDSPIYAPRWLLFPLAVTTQQRQLAC